jgi:hypothetical protein
MTNSSFLEKRAESLEQKEGEKSVILAFFGNP